MTHAAPTTRRRAARVLLAALLAVCGLASPPRATAVDPYNNSLDWVPADASAYSASLRLKEQFDLVANSNAWKTFRAMPAVAQGWAMAEAQINDPEGDMAALWQIMSLPENKQLAQVAGEMFSDEIVFYAGADFVKLIELMQVIQGSRLTPVFQALAEGPEALGGPPVLGADDTNANRMQIVLETIVEDPALIDVPELVVAFRVKDQAAATTQLARLEVFANLALDQTGVGAKFERREFNDTEFLVLFLDGTMLPLPVDAPFGLGIDEDSYQKLRDVIREKELYVALGVWNDYVVLSIDNSTENLGSFGRGDAISGRPEFAKLDAQRDGKLVGVTYVSREIMASQVLLASDLQELADAIAELVSLNDEVPAPLKERLDSDLDEFAADLKKYLPTAGAAAGWQFLTDAGFEGFSYDWTQYYGRDGSKPVELARHLGGNPILAVAGRGIDDPETYDLLVKWMRRGYGYLTEFAVPEMEEDEREEFNKAMGIITPLATRFDEVTRTKLLPALSDGQSGFIFDAKIASKQWFPDMPASAEPVPMPELGLIVGVTDRAKLVEAMSDYRTLINDIIDAIREQNPDDVPEEVQFPAPEPDETDNGIVYTWPIPAEIGLDGQIVPCTAVNDHVGVFATSRALAERVLAEQPLAGAAALGSDDEARAMVVGFSWAELVSAVEPWVVYAMRHEMLGAEGAAASLTNDPQPVQELLGQVKTGLAILKCFRGVCAEVTREDDAWVTHTIISVEDLED